MNPGDIAPMIVMVTFALVIGGVLLLRPLASRLGDLLVAATEEKRRVPSGDDVAQVRRIVESIDSRVALLEERLNFQESLLAGRREALGAATDAGARAEARQTDRTVRTPLMRSGGRSDGAAP